MGLLDHNRTWHFKLAATPDECATAFIDAMHGKSGLNFRKAKWVLSTKDTRSTLPAIVATYGGRSGIASVLTALYGSRAAATEAAAKGSQITFEVKDHDPATGRATCAMWLSLAGKQLAVFTADAGFYRSYMRDVARKLAEIDSSLSTSKA